MEDLATPLSLKGHDKEAKKYAVKTDLDGTKQVTVCLKLKICVGLRRKKGIHIKSK